MFRPWMFCPLLFSIFSLDVLNPISKMYETFTSNSENTDHNVFLTSLDMMVKLEGIDNIGLQTD